MPVIKDLLEVILLLSIDWLHPEVIYDEDIHQFLHCVVCDLVAQTASLVAKGTRKAERVN